MGIFLAVAQPFLGPRRAAWFALVGVAGYTLLVGAEAAAPYAPAPFVWSDQYDVNIQVLGRPELADTVEVVQGSVEDRNFIAAYGRQGTLIGAVGFNGGREMVGYRRLLMKQGSVDDARAHGAETAG